MHTVAAESARAAQLGRSTVEALSCQRWEPAWLLDARLAAWERYEALPRPSTRDEAWKRTDISALDLDRLAMPGLERTPATASPLPLELDDVSERAGLLVLRNGEVQQRLLDEQLAARGVLLLSLAEAVEAKPDLVRAYLGADRSRPNDNKLTALSEALWSDGAFVYLPAGQAISEPLHVLHCDDLEGPSFAHTLVMAEEGSSAALVESFASAAGRGESLAGGTAHLALRQAARVSYTRLQERDEQAWDFTALHSEQERDSAMTWLLLGLGARLSRTELSCDLPGQGAEADILGLAFGDGQQHFDFHTLQNHRGSDTRSDLVLRVALQDQAISNFTGLIRVGHSALRTASNQENRNLLLSGEAKADSDPKLEILNSDVVRCGHGATVGPVDEEMIFYLMTRGLSHDEAERLIVEGFFEPLLARIPLAGVRERFWASVHRKLERIDTHG